ncbi:hypothetical protein V2J09_013266 [Rumex salicifolius]
MDLHPPMAVINAVLITVLTIIVSTILTAAYQTLSFYWLIPRRIRKAMKKQGVRGPPSLPLLGNLPDMARLLTASTAAALPSPHHHALVPRLLPQYLLWSRLYGKRFIFWNGSEPRMCLTDPDMIKELLSKYTMVTGKSWLQQQGSKNFVGRGLLMANGHQWHRQRHLVAPAFMGDKLKMVEWLAEKREVEIGEQMSRLTADIISRVEFGSSYEKGKRIFDLLTILQQRCAQASRHLCFPGSRFFPSNYNKDIKGLKTEVERLLMEIIESRRGCVEMGRSDSYGNDLLGILLNEMSKQKNKEAGEGDFNLQLIMDECKTFFFAGHETVALLLTWTLMLLSSNPCWQDKVRAEVAQVCNDGPPALDHLPKLSLLNMVINETLRLYPPATLLPRMAFEDIKLGDLLIPNGLSIWIPVLAIHHDRDLWGDDADEFNPDRFSTRSNMSGRFFPFGLGPRNCIGQSFAMMEAKIILAMLISKFKFTLSESYSHAPITVLTIKPKHGVQVFLERLST